MLRNLSKLNSSVLSSFVRHAEQRTTSLPWLPCVMCSPQQQQQRYASSVGQYDRMWQSVNSGKGNKVVRKMFPNGFEGWGFGSQEVTIPGFNAPLESTPSSQVSKWGQPSEDGLKKRPARELKWMTRKGWTGRGYQGRGVGHPITEEGVEMKEFDSCVIEVKRIAKMKRTGKSMRTSALVVVGNRNGALGWGIGRGKTPMTAIKKGRNKAMNFLHEVPVCDGHTVYHQIVTKFNRTAIQMERRVPGHGLRAQRIVKAMADLAGIKDMRAKLRGITTPLTVVQVTMQALLCQESHQELADRTGKSVLELDAGLGRPRVVAYPAPEAALLGLGQPYDPMGVLKPHLRRHNQKTIRSVKERNPDLVKNTYENNTE